jgi:hypothetical protein
MTTSFQIHQSLCHLRALQLVYDPGSCVKTRDPQKCLQLVGLVSNEPEEV